MKSNLLGKEVNNCKTFPAVAAVLQKLFFCLWKLCYFLTKYNDISLKRSDNFHNSFFNIFMHNHEKWLNVLRTPCGVNIFNHMKRFLKYVCPCFNIMHGKGKDEHTNIWKNARHRGQKIYLGELASYHRSYWVFQL